MSTISVGSKGRLLLAAAPLALILGGTPAHAAAAAQDQAATAAAPVATPSTDTDAATNVDIVVTGSRIKSALPTTVAPVQVISSALIQDSGAINIQDTLLANPVFGTPSFSRTANAFNSSGAGLATVDLRNLGVDRTLVLVNGRRVVSGVPGNNAVDLNMIPTQMVDRVEVLTSGSASAIYGSDAVAGVVNFILKDNFQGVEANVQAGIAETRDDREIDASVLMGGNFGDGRGNATLFIGYSDQGAAYERDHKTEAGPSDIDGQSGIFFGEGIFTAHQPVYSSYAPQGAYYTDNTVFTYSPTGALQPCFTSSAATCAGGVGPNGFNRTAFRYLAVPIQRYLANFNGHYDISDAATVFLEGSFQSVQAATTIEPFPFDTTYVTADGQIPIETLYNGVPFRNPYVPNAIYNDSSDTNGDGLRDIFVTKRLSDFGSRAYRSTQNTFRLVGGLRGEFAKGWNYEAFANYGETDVNQYGTGQFNALNFRQALNIIPDGAGGYQCADATARAQGCVPANIFGLGSLSAAAVSYLAAPQFYQAYNKETQVGANVVGSIKNPIGASDIGITVGTEYRREAQDSRWDALQTQGLNGSNKLPPTSGAFDLYEFYGEALLPLISQGFVEDFSIRGAARYSHYSTVGDTFSFNFGGEFAPVRDIRFRAMYARTVRAPNVSELFAGQSQDFPTVDDPCAGIGATGGGAVGDNCRAAPGVAANIAANGTFLVTQADRQGVTSFAGGNPNLKAEKGRTLTAGVVINPRSISALRNFTVTADYFRVKINGAIVNTPLQFILDQCYTQSNTGLCSFVTRRLAAQGPNTAGSIFSVNSGPTNSGGIVTSGVDVTVNYTQTFGVGSQRLRANLNAAYTHLLSGYTVPLPDQPVDYFEGEVGAAGDRFTVTAEIGTPTVKLALTGTYTGSSWIDDQFDGYHVYKVHAEYYQDAQLRFYVKNGMEFYVGGKNLFDNSPVYFASVNGAVTGQDSDTGTYDPIGRRFYVGAKLKF